MTKYGKGLYANVLRNFLSNSYRKDQAKSLDGFQRDDSFSGQRVQVYNKPDTKQTVVVHRGTKGFVRGTSRPRIYLYNYYDIYILYATNSRLLYYCLIN